MPDQATALRRLARDSTAAGASTTHETRARETNPRETNPREVTSREQPAREPATADTVTGALPHQVKVAAFPSASPVAAAPYRVQPSGIASIRRPLGPTSRATVIAVTSGKGGVGKSNVAVNLAARFSASGKRVLLLDADLGLANADVLCGVDVPFNLSHVVARRRSVREVVVKVPPERGGFELVGGASGLSRMADLDEAGRTILLDALVELEMTADVVIVDTGAGISSNVLAFCRAADQVLVVTTPEPTAVTDAYALVKTLVTGHTGDAGGINGKISLLVNQVATPAEGRAVYERVSKVARQFLSVQLLDAGHVLLDEEMTRAVRRRIPLVMHDASSPASRCLAQLAARMEQSAGPFGAYAGPNNGQGFFRRLVRRVKGRG